VVATSLHEKLIKIGAKVVSHGRYITFQMAEVAVSRQMFADMLALVARLRAPPALAWGANGIKFDKRQGRGMTLFDRHSPDSGGLRGQDRSFDWLGQREMAPLRARSDRSRLLTVTGC
jgi:hypothetical protein